MRLPALAGAALLCVQAPAVSQSQSPPGALRPLFRSSVDVTLLDVSVVQSDGLPVANLRPEDFTVRIDGRTRRVVGAEWVAQTRAAATPSPTLPPDGYSSNEATPPGRLIVIAIDQPNIRMGGASAIRQVVSAFIDRLQPADRAAVVALGASNSTPFTADRERLKEAVGRMSGDMQPVTEIAASTINITAAEAIEIAEGSQTALQAVVLRECQRTRAGNSCPEQVTGDAHNIALQLRQATSRTLVSLQGLLENLKTIEGSKTLVVVSEGFVIVSQAQAIQALGSLAAAARTSIYGLRLDERAFDMGTARRAPYGPADRQLRASGFDLLTSISKGGVFEVVAAGGTAVERLEREMSGYYLVAVESAQSDVNGRLHPVSVQVGRRGAVVRARRELPEPDVTRPRTPSQAQLVSSGLSSPLVMPGLAVRVATFSLRDQDPSQIQVVIHADIGSGYTSEATLTVGYAISDKSGTSVLTRMGAGEIAPRGISSPLPYMSTATVPPGEYILRLVVAEGEHVGSVDHPFHAGLIQAESLTLSELMIGDATGGSELSIPTLSYDMNFGGIQGYLEAYGNTANLLVRYEVAQTPDSPALLSDVVTGRPGKDGGTVYSHVMRAPALPEGQYVFRATLADGASPDRPLKQITRPFRVPSTSAR